MKHITVSLLFLFTTLLSYAQQLQLEGEVTLQEGNIYARRFPRNDSKGKPCALIMVRSSNPDLTFTGEISGDVTYDNATYLVYLSPGSTKLTVANGPKNLLNLKFAPLESKATYEVIILDTSDKGSLSLSTIPSGADVYLVNKSERIHLGRTPLKGNLQIKTGVYRIEVEKKGYQLWRKKAVEIRKGKPTDLGKIKLKKS